MDETVSETEPLAIGIIGGGFIGTTVGAGFRDHEAADIVGLVDIDEDVLAEAGVELGVDGDRWYTDYETMLAAEAETLNAVLIGTPHTLHYEQILTAFDHDLHVLCDKPLTTDLDGARDLVARDHDREQVLMVGYQRHLDPAFIRTRSVWADEEREPRWITAQIGQPWVDRFEDTWRQNPELSGGGYLYDTGSHLLDCVLWTTQLTPEAVSATMHFIDEDSAEPRSADNSAEPRFADSRAAAPRGRVDGSGSVTIRFTNGAMATFAFSGETPCMREHIWMWDEQGAVGLSAHSWEPSDYVEIDVDNGEYWPRIRRSTRRTKADAFIEAIRTGEEPVATALDGLRVTAVTEAAYESARTDGSFVTVDPDDVALE
jgi:predicted dehydrogenase